MVKTANSKVELVEVARPNMTRFRQIKGISAQIICDTPEFGGRCLGRLRNPDLSGFSLIQAARKSVQMLFTLSAIKRSICSVTGKYFKKESPTDGGTENPHPSEVLRP